MPSGEHNKSFRPMHAAALSLVMAVVVGALFWKYGLSVQAVTYIMLAAILCIVSLVDINTSTIPNRFIVIGIILWAATVWLMPVDQRSFGQESFTAAFFGQGILSVLADRIIGAVVVAGGVLLASVVTEQITKRPTIGGGDIKMLFMVGLYLGLYGSLVNLFLSCVIGLIVAAVWRQRKRNQQKSTQSAQTFPFGPAIAIATIVTLVSL